MMRVTALALVASMTSFAVAGAARADEAPPAPPAPPVYAPGYASPYASPDATGYAQQPYLPQPQQQLRYEERPRYGLLGAGLGIFGGVWALNASVAYLSGDATLAVPIVGPLIEIAHYSSRTQYDCAYPGNGSSGYSSCGGGGGSDNSGDRLLYLMLVLDAGVQATGVIMAGAGLFSKRKVAVFDGPQLTSLVPMVTPSSAGLAAMGSF